MNPSSISITLNNVDITNKCLFRECTFTAQANPIQGTFRIAVKDVAQDFAPVAGQKVRVTIDGVPIFGGYVMSIERGFFFPAEDTSNPTQVVRKWTLSGPDFNLLFDKRVLYDPNDFTAALTVPVGKRTISKAYKYMMANFIDIPNGLDYLTYIDDIDTEFGSETEGSSLVGQGKTWREQMEDFMDHGAVMYYIDGDFNVHLHEYESLNVPWIFVDSNPNGVTSIGFREGTYSEDYLQIVTDALVWGGSSISTQDGGTGGDVVFARYPDPPANDATWSGRLQSAAREQQALDRRSTYGRWQMAEERVGQNNYLTQGSVKTRAFAIINGPPGAVPTYGVESGYSKPIATMRCSWFAHDVPSGQHVRPGYLMSFILYTQGTSGQPLITTLPLRSMTITFPTLPPDSPGDTYVRFDGDFGVSFSDRRYLWKAIKRSNRIRYAKQMVTLVDNFSESVAVGSIAQLWPNEDPNGTRTTFTFTKRFLQGELDLFLNGLRQRENIDYTYSGTNKSVTFAVAPEAGDQIWAVGRVSDG